MTNIKYLQLNIPAIFVTEVSSTSTRRYLDVRFPTKTPETNTASKKVGALIVRFGSFFLNLWMTSVMQMMILH